MANEAIEQFLRVQPQELTVPRGQEIVVDTDQDFHGLELRSYEDLQALSLVPAPLSEKAVHDAIAADDQEVWESVDRAGHRGRGGCPDGREHVANDKARFQARRNDHHRALAEVVSRATETQVARDDLLVKAIHSWVKKLTLQVVVQIMAVKFADITIAHNATLTVIPATKVLWAEDIRIHTGGRLRSQSGYLKVRCSSVQGNIP